MNGYAKYTPLRIAFPFILGVSAGIFFKGEIPFAPVLLSAIALSILFFVSFIVLRSNYPLRWMPGLFASAGLFFAGLTLLTAEERKDLAAAARGPASGETAFLLCKMEESEAPGKFAVQSTAIVVAFCDSAGNWNRCHEKALFYFKGDSIPVPGAGHLFIANASLRALEPPANPDVFNYKRYMSYQHIQRQSYLEPHQWLVCDSSGSWSVFVWASRSRDKLLDIFSSFGLEGRDFALAAALITGLKDHLERDTRQEFAYAGAMHVLCVSGLHVGILFAVADKLLFFMGRNRKGRQARSFIILFIIWIYAFITGLSPSVQRASLMFSLLAAGRMARRGTENYNILAVAAFIQLWMDPYAMTSLGFQLSYLAVLGIFAFYKPLNELLQSGNKALTWIWSVVSVSTAAQLATFPLAAFYFNIFPVYFLFTNLIVVPLAGFIIYYAVFLLLSGGLGFIHAWLAWPLTAMLRLMSLSVEWIQSWPGAVIEALVLSGGQVVILYALIIVIFIMMMMRSRQWIYYLPALLILLSSTVSFRINQRSKTCEITVYHIPGYTAIDLIHNKKAYFISDMDTAKENARIEYQLKPHRIREGVREIVTIHPDSGIVLAEPGVYLHYPFFLFHGKRVLIMDEKEWPSFPGDFFSPDLLVLRKSLKNSLNSFSGVLPSPARVIDSSVPKYEMEGFESKTEPADQPYHIVGKAGAYTLKW